MRRAAFAFAFLSLVRAGQAADPLLPGDVIPPNSRPVSFVAKVEPGPFASGVFRSYEITRGDTLEAIAKRECGDVRAVAEIQLLNPDLKPEKLQPETSIVIPPRFALPESRPTTRADLPTADYLLFFVAFRFGQRHGPHPILEGRELPRFRGGGYVLAVARGRLGWFLGIDWYKVTNTPPEGILYSEPIHASETVAEKSRAFRVVTTLTLTGSKGDRLLGDVVVRRYDRAGEIVTDAEPPRDGAPKKGALPWPVVALGVAALVGAVGIAMRRRAASREAGVP